VAKDKTKEQKEQVTVLLPVAVARQLKAKAVEERRTRSQLAAILIEDALRVSA